MSLSLLFVFASSNIKNIETDYSDYSSFNHKFIEGKTIFTDLDHNVISFADAANGYIESDNKFIALEKNLNDFVKEKENVTFVSPAGNNGTMGPDAQESHLNANKEVAVIGSLKNNKTTKNSQISSILLLSENYDNDNVSSATTNVATLLDQMINELKGETRETLYAKLALSAKIIDPEHPSWIKNSHGVSFSSVYGFGQAQAEKAKAINFEEDMKHKSFTATNDVNKSIPYATKLSKEVIKVSGSEIKGITFLTFSFSTNHMHNSALHVKITSPSGTGVDVFLGRATEGHYPGYDYELYFENKYQFSTRAFLGEAADGEWTIEIGHAGFVPLNYYINPTLTFYGFTKELPETKQEKGENERVIDGSIPEATSLKCNTKIEGLEGGKTYILVENVSGKLRKRSIPKTSEGNFVVPCLYKNNINLLIVEENTNKAVQNVTVTNEYTFPKVINTDPFSQIKPDQSVHTFKYVRQDEHLSPLEEHAFATVTIYDQHLRRLRYMGSHEDTGEITIDFKDKDNFKRAVLTIEPQQIVDYCDIVLLPFRYIEDSMTYKYDVFVDTGKCDFNKLDIPIQLPRRLRPLDHRGKRAFLIGFFVPFTTVFATIIASAIWYLVVARNAVDDPVGELGASFVP